LAIASATSKQDTAGSNDSALAWYACAVKLLH
jgi:hypothetical protein